MKPTKLTPVLLKRIVQEEVTRHKRLQEKFGKGKKTEDSKATEVDADELGTDKALENKKDHAEDLDETVVYAKALKVEEARLRRLLARIAEARKNVLQKIVKSV